MIEFTKTVNDAEQKGTYLGLEKSLKDLLQNKAITVSTGEKRYKASLNSLQSKQLVLRRWFLDEKILAGDTLKIKFDERAIDINGRTPITITVLEKSENVENESEVIFQKEVINDNNSFEFLFEANLRDFLIENLHTVKGYKLKLFNDAKNSGKEFPTDGGRIDILATDENGNFFVFELKLSKGVDKALGQLLCYMGWIRRNLANGKEVKGIIVANKMDDKIKIGVTETPNVLLYEYDMKFDLTKITD